MTDYGKELIEFVMTLSAEGIRGGLSQATGYLREYNRVTGEVVDMILPKYRRISETVGIMAANIGNSLGAATDDFNNFGTATKRSSAGFLTSFDGFANRVENALLRSAQNLHGFSNEFDSFSKNIRDETNLNNANLVNGINNLNGYGTAIRGVSRSANLAANAINKMGQATSGASANININQNIGGTVAMPPGVTVGGGGGGGGGGTTQAPTTAADRVLAQINATQRALDSLEVRAARATGTMARLFAVMLGSAVAPAKIFGDFEATMNRFASVADATKQQLDAFADTAKRLGQVTQFSAKEIGLAGVELAKLGFTSSQSIQMLPGVLNAAAAGQISLAKAAEITSAALRGFYGEDVSKSVHIADLFAKAAAKSAVDFSDLGETFKYVSGIAKSSSQDIEGITALIAIMGNQMIKGSMAGTALRSALISLNNPSEKARQIFHALGVQTIDPLTGKLRQLPDILKDMSVAFRGVDESTKNAAVSTIFGERALSGMLAVLNQTPAQIDAMVASMHSVDGASKEMADVAFKGLNAEFLKFQRSMEAAAMTIGEQMSPMLIRLMNDAKKVIQEFTALPVEIKENIAQTVLWTATLSGAGFAIFGTIKGIASLISMITQLIGVQRIAAATSLAMQLNTQAVAVTTGAYSVAIQAGATRTGAFSSSVKALSVMLGANLINAITTLGPFIARLSILLYGVKKAFDLATDAVEIFKNTAKADDEQTKTIEIQSKAMGTYGAVLRKMQDPQNKGKAIFDTVTSKEVYAAAQNLQALSNAATDPKKKQELQALSDNWRAWGDSIKATGDKMNRVRDIQKKIQELNMEKSGKLDIDKSNIDKQIKQLQSESDSLVKGLKIDPNLAGKGASSVNLDYLSKKNVELNQSLLDITQKQSNARSKGLKALDKEYEKLTANLSIKLRDLEIEKKKQEEIQITAGVGQKAFKSEIEFAKFIYGKNAEVGRGGSGPRGSHYHGYEARDMAVPEKTPVKAGFGGIVSYSGSKGDYGEVIEVSHGNGLKTRYAHNTLGSMLPVGTKVEQGQTIALSGNTGRSSGPHGHFETLLNNNQIKIEKGIELIQRLVGFKGSPDIKITQKMEKEIDSQISTLKSMAAKYEFQGDSVKAAEVLKAAKQLEEKKSDIRLEFINKRKQEEKQISQEIVKAEKEREAELLKNEKHLYSELEQMNDKYTNMLDAADKKIRQKFMTPEQKAEDDFWTAINKEVEDIIKQKSAIETSDITETAKAEARKKLDEMKKRLDQYVAKTAPELEEMKKVAKTITDLKELEDVAKTRNEGIDKRIKREEKKIEESPNLASSARKTLVDLYTEKGDLIDAQMKKFKELPKSEQDKPENQKIYNDLLKQTDDLISGIVISESDAVAELDKQLSALADQEKLWKDISNASEYAGNTIKGIGSLMSLFGGKDKSAQEGSAILNSVGETANAVSSIFKDIEKDGDWMSAIAKGGLKIISELRNVVGIFPDNDQIKKEAFEFKNSLVGADIEIAKTRLESQKALGQITGRAYYDELKNIGKQENEKAISEIEFQRSEALKNTKGVIDTVGDFLGLGVSSYTKNKMEQVNAQYDKAIEAQKAKHKAAQDQIDSDDLKRAEESAKRIQMMQADIAVSFANRRLDRIAQIEEAHYKKKLENQNALSEQFKKLQNGDITLEEYQKALDIFNEAEAENDDDMKKQKKAHYNEMRDLDNAHWNHVFSNMQDALQKRLYLNAESANQELQSTRDRISELEDLGLTWTGEYKKLKQKESDVLAEALKRDKEIQEDYNHEIAAMRIQLREINAEIMAGELDDLEVARDKQILELDKWRTQALRDNPEQEKLINDIYDSSLKRINLNNAKSQREYFSGINQSYRELLVSQAEATKDGLDDVKTEYANALSQINDSEALILQDHTKTEQQKTFATKKAIADRITAQRKYYDSLGNMAKEELNTVKTLRQQMFEAMTEKNDAMIIKYEEELSKVELRIRELQLILNQQAEKYDKQRKDFTQKDLDLFTSGQSGIDLQAKVREALKIAGVNITDTTNEAAGQSTRREAMDTYVKYLEQKASDDYILKLISGEEKQKQLQEAQLIRAKFNLDQINEVTAGYDKQIQAAIDAGVATENISVIEAQKIKEVENLRANYADAFEKYKELELKKIEEAQAAEAKDTKDKIESQEEIKKATQNNLDAEKNKVDELRIQYESDMKKIDYAIKSVDLAHQKLIGNVDQLRESMKNNLSGTLDEIIKKYQTLETSMEKVGATITPNNLSNISGSFSPSSATSGATGTGGSTQYSIGMAGSGTTAISNIPRRADTGSGAPAGFPVQYGDYWYQNTTDAIRATRGYAMGGILPDVPGMKNRDIFPIMAAPGEEIVNADDRISLVKLISGFPANFARAITNQSQTFDNKSIKNIINMTNHVRDDRDLEAIKNIIMNTYRSQGINIYSYLTR